MPSFKSDPSPVFVCRQQYKNFSRIDGNKQIERTSVRFQKFLDMNNFTQAEFVRFVNGVLKEYKHPRLYDSYISAYRHGRCCPKHDWLHALSFATGVSESWFQGYGPEKNGRMHMASGVRIKLVSGR